MPCFKGLAVSIHSDGPLPEYSIQKISRISRITSYIPVPPPKLNPESGVPEQCSFAVSITLLTPGMAVPYSTPKSTSSDPLPKPQIVGGLPGMSAERGRYLNSVKPYEALTSSPNETIAAYIYFDGRQKEEVATLLRRGEETWVNSRWVSVPESEGGGLAERDFLFREVGLERWLNGLDLEGKDIAAKVERRRQRMEKRRRRRTAGTPGSGHDEGMDDTESNDLDGRQGWRRERKHSGHDGVLRYGADDTTPLEKLSEEEDSLSSGEDSDDDPIPESTGQIKVALFRVLASGEIKKGEYSPQFDAHDDDDDFNREGGDGEIDHTTSFAKPKTLDPKTISTQTVTGIDGPDKPFAVFTFLYRGEKQLQKMGILKSNKPSSQQAPPSKRGSMGTDFANLKPLKPGGTIGFTGVREEQSPTKNGKGRALDDMDSDEDEDAAPKAAKPEEAEAEDFKDTVNLSAEELKKHGELADGVKKIKLKRQHSFDPDSSQKTPPEDKEAGNSPPLLGSAAYNPQESKGASANNAAAASVAASSDNAIIGSPLKKPRASVSGVESEFRRSGAEAVAKGLGFGFVGDIDKAGTGKVELGGELPKVKEESKQPSSNVGPGLPGAQTKVKSEDNMEEEL